MSKKEAENKAQKKQSSKTYDKKLKIEGTLYDVLKVSTETKKHGDKSAKNKQEIPLYSFLLTQEEPSPEAILWAKSII